MSLEIVNTSPKLKVYDFIVGDKNVVIENTQTGTQAILPLESLDFLELIDGTRSVKQIIAEVFEKTGKIYFDTVIKVIKLLNDIELLEDLGLEFDSISVDKSPRNQSSSIFVRPFYKLMIIKKISFGLNRGILSYLMFAVLVTGACLGINQILNDSFGFEMGNFLKSRFGYSKAIFHYFIITSALLSIRGLYKIIYQLFVCSNVYGIQFRVNFLSVSLDVLDNSIYTLTRKIHAILYFVSANLIFIASAFVFAIIFPKHFLINDVYIIAILLTLNFLDPFRKGDLTNAFHFVYAQDQLESLSPYLKNKTFSGLFKTSGNSNDDLRFAIYSFLAILWAVSFTLFASDLMVYNFPRLLFEIQIGGEVEMINAGLIFLLLTFNFLYLFIDLAHTVLHNIFSPLSRSLIRMKSKGKEITVDEVFQEGALEKIKKDFVLGTLSEKAIRFLLSQSSIKKMKANSNLIVQGDRSKNVYFVLEGEINVSIKEFSTKVKNIVDLRSPCIVGEIALLKEVDRTASVITKTNVTYVEIKPRIFKKLVENELFKDDYERLINRIELSQYISSASLFADFPSEIMHLFVEAGDMVIFPPDQNIVEQDENDKTFYLLLKGSVDIIKDGEKITELHQGDYFGEIALLANSKRTATVRTTEKCLFLFIESDKFWKILINNIDLGIYLEAVTKQRIEGSQ